MNIDRRHLVLPAVAVGLIGVVSALAASPEEDAVAKNLEAFRAAQIAADAKAFDVLCAAELSYSHSDARVERPSSPTPPRANRNSWCWNIWTRKSAWSVPPQSCGSTGWPKASRLPTAPNPRPTFIS